jgi:hypothetical protein
MKFLNDKFRVEFGDEVRERVAFQVSTIAKLVSSPSQLRRERVASRRTLSNLELVDIAVCIDES